MGKLDDDISGLLVLAYALEGCLSHEIVARPARNLRFNDKRRLRPMHVAQGLWVIDDIEGGRVRLVRLQLFHKFRKVSGIVSGAHRSDMNELSADIGTHLQ